MVFSEWKRVGVCMWRVVGLGVSLWRYGLREGRGLLIGNFQQEIWLSYKSPCFEYNQFNDTSNLNLINLIF